MSSAHVHSGHVSLERDWVSLKDLENVNRVRWSSPDGDHWLHRARRIHYPSTGQRRWQVLTIASLLQAAALFATMGCRRSAFDLIVVFTVKPHVFERERLMHLFERPRECARVDDGVPDVHRLLFEGFVDMTLRSEKWLDTDGSILFLWRRRRAAEEDECSARCSFRNWIDHIRDRVAMSLAVDIFPCPIWLEKIGRAHVWTPVT